MAWPRRILLACSVVAIVAGGPRAFESLVAPDDLARIERERASLERKNRELRHELQLLRGEVEALKHDPREIARIARQDLNLSAPGDLVFELDRSPTR